MGPTIDLLIASTVDRVPRQTRIDAYRYPTTRIR